MARDAPDLILAVPESPVGEILKRAQDLFEQPRLTKIFAQLGMEEAAGLFGFYLLDDDGLRRFSAGAQINTDDRTLLEYHAPRARKIKEGRRSGPLFEATSDGLKWVSFNSPSRRLRMLQWPWARSGSPRFTCRSPG